MAARKFRAVQRSQVPDLAAQTAGEQVIHLHSQNLGHHEEFQIGNTAGLFFEPGDRFAAGVPPEELKFDRKAGLGPAVAQTQRPNLRTNDIQMNNTVCDIPNRSRSQQGIVCALLHKNG